MNAIIKRPAFEEGIDSAKERFEVLAGGHLQYGDEEIFAMQALTKNDFVFNTANKNPRSVQLAMINVASTGLTLNPAHGYAYLVPRDGAIVLDISYKGLIKIATDTGAILWARAECVHENDHFDYRGPAAAPEIRTDPFRDRGEIIGAYCIAKTAHGDILCEVMDRAALEQVRSASTAYAKGGTGKKGPWENYFAEMCKKAVIKRARKTWPYTDPTGKMALAVDLANKAEGGYTFDAGGGEAPPDDVNLSPEEKKEREAAKRRAEHDAALARHSESVTFIKERIGADDLPAAIEEWKAIPQTDQLALWLAPSKGGCLTTEERRLIKENGGNSGEAPQA
jgi:recombination protein RecT